MDMNFISLTTDETLHMGSFVVKSKNKTIFELVGLSSDVQNLPTVDSIGTGSTAYCVDSKELYMYEKTSKTWYLQ